MLTGGLGYIGSNTALSLLRAKNEIVIYDNLSNSSIKTVEIIEKLSGKKVSFVKGDISDSTLLIETLKNFEINAVIHFAGYKSVFESVSSPLDYYLNNLSGTISLINAMKSLSIKRLIFSSSATVYGSQPTLPITEDQPKKCISPYGRTKSFIEDILIDLSSSDSNWKISCLRYFNPVGADSSGFLGDNSSELPSNLLPRILKVAAGDLASLEVFGTNYKTNDGTCERDYIHVSDLAEGHLSALEYLAKQEKGIEFFNLGTGKSCGVLELISIFEKTTGMQVSYVKGNKREGDSEVSYANVDKAYQLLKWRSKKSLEDMCSTAWNSYKLNRASQNDE